MAVCFFKASRKISFSNLLRQNVRQACHAIKFTYFISQKQGGVPPTLKDRQIITPEHGDQGTTLEFCLPNKPKHSEKSLRNNKRKSRKNGLHPKVSPFLPQAFSGRGCSPWQPKRKGSSVSLPKAGITRKGHERIYNKTTRAQEIKIYDILLDTLVDSDIKVWNTILVFPFFQSSIVSTCELLHAS